MLGGTVVPLLAWAPTTGRRGRHWVAVIAAVTALTHRIWGRMEWWTPRLHPTRGRPRTLRKSGQLSLVKPALRPP